MPFGSRCVVQFWFFFNNNEFATKKIKQKISYHRIKERKKMASITHPILNKEQIKVMKRGNEREIK